jgi:hypothetical protein
MVKGMRMSDEYAPTINHFAERNKDATLNRALSIL